MQMRYDQFDFVNNHKITVDESIDELLWPVVCEQLFKCFGVKHLIMNLRKVYNTVHVHWC